MHLLHEGDRCWSLHAPKTFPEAGVITLSLFSLICSSACSLLSRFGEFAPNKDFISNSLFSEEARPTGMRTGYGAATKPKPHGVPQRTKGWTPERPAQRQQGGEPTARPSESRTRRRRAATRQSPRRAEVRRLMMVGHDVGEGGCPAQASLRNSTELPAVLRPPL